MQSPRFVEAAYVQVVVADLIHTSATALLVYDTLLTFAREASLVWKGDFSWFAVLYVTNRYAAICNRVAVTLERIHWHGRTSQSCVALLLLDVLFLVVTWLSIASKCPPESTMCPTRNYHTAFSALRAYALSGKHLWVLIVAIAFGLILPAADLYQLSVILSGSLDGSCNSALSLSAQVLTTYQMWAGIYLRLTLGTADQMIPSVTSVDVGVYMGSDRFCPTDSVIYCSPVATAARASMIASDLFVLVVTLYSTYSGFRESRQDGVPSLSHLLLKDGAIYFAVLFVCNLCDILLLQLSVNGAIADLVTVLSVILVARFLLRLRALRKSHRESSNQLSSVETDPRQFRPTSFVESFAGSLHLRVPEDPDSEDF
ncbi:hypothetical protein BD413DRAFT_674517 [Trametes elegans]|nr:hypothetical protein BD413DRAFT_674517 [Trametes elegans]